MEGRASLRLGSSKRPTTVITSDKVKRYYQPVIKRVFPRIEPERALCTSSRKQKRQERQEIQFPNAKVMGA